MPVNLGAAATFKQVAATPGTPPASHQSLYVKSTGRLATENSSGVEQAILDGTDWMKQACDAMTIGNITLSGAQTVDGGTSSAGQRVLVKNQTTPAQNGIYLSSASSWTRTNDANTAALLAGAVVSVLTGGNNVATTWRTDFVTNGILNTANVNWYMLRDNEMSNSVRAVYSTNVAALATATSTVDGITLVQNDRVLLVGQTTTSQNGVYQMGVVSAGAGPLTRPPGFATSIEVAALGVVEVREGTTYGGTGFMTTFKATDTLSTTAMLWNMVPKQVPVTTTAPTSPQIGDMYYDTSAPTYTSSGAASLSGNNTLTGQNGFLAQTQFTPNIQFTSAYTNSTPSGGSTQGANVFVRHKGKNVLAYGDYLGEDHRVQDSLYANSWHWVQAINNNATLSTSGIVATVLNNAGSAATAVALASTNFYAGRKRFRVASTTTAATAGELRANTADSYISATANDGGFYFVARFGLNTVATNTRGFIGLNTVTTAYPAGSNPGAGLNQIGFYWDTGMTTIHFINSSGTLGSSIDMGANFPTSTSAATYFYEAAIWMPAGSTTVCNFSITRLNDGLATATTAGTTGSGSNFPAAGTLLAWHLFYGNGSNAVAHAMDIQSVYLLSDN